MFFRDTQILPLLSTRNTADVTVGKSIAILLQSISGMSAVDESAVDERERCYSFALSRTKHETHTEPTILLNSLSFRYCTLYQSFEN
jgi:hypothetical protein